MVLAEAEGENRNFLNKWRGFCRLKFRAKIEHELFSNYLNLVIHLAAADRWQRWGSKQRVATFAVGGDGIENSIIRGRRIVVVGEFGTTKEE